MKVKAQKILANGKRVAIKASLVGAGLTASAVTLAADHSTAINAAGADGATNIGAAVTVLISLVAVSVGVGFVVSLLRNR